jgi:hypothetical protein
MKINASKIAFICFRLFAFIFSNRDFPMGYGGFKQKFFSRPREPALVVNAHASRPVIMFVGMGRGALGDRVSHREIIAEVSSLRKKMSHIREFHSPAAAATNRILRMIAIDRR